MNQSLYDLMEENPVIAAVSDMEGLKTCCKISEIKVVFILFGDICNISSIVGQLREQGKTAIVHIDLVKGLDSKEIAVDFIKDYAKAEGIISTKPFLIKRARELSLCTILRIFLLDSMALANIQRQMDVARPDAIEILPGLMPKAIKRVSSIIKVPLIVGGLISDKEDVMAALAGGAFSVSTTNPKVWEL
ncbi:MAG: glycerol-3-phosphate responsive antiterminator [Hungatella sp.]|nr:glycerol-3-phosphate responsive antiterminator [Hungatella sp.]